MLTLNTLDIQSTDLDSLTLTWNWTATTEPVAGYLLNIERSITPSGAWTVIATGISADDYSYLDSTISGLYHTWIDWYYRFEVYSGLTSKTMPDYEYFRMERDLQAKYIIRSKARGLSLYTEPVAIIKRRINGTYCPICWDIELGRRTLDDCQVCYDTSFTGGYYPQINVWGVINPNPKRNQLTEFGEWHPGDNLFTMLNFPRIMPKDVIVDPRNRRWRIVDVRQTEKRMYLISQQARIEQIDLGDVIYHFEVEHPTGKTWRDYSANI